MKKTECNRNPIEFTALNRRSVLGSFDGDSITSDAGLLLLRETNEKFQIIQQFASCFTDHRNQDYIDHTVEELLAQRIFALCAGNEDLNDHDELKEDALYSVLVNKAEQKNLLLHFGCKKNLLQLF